MPKQTSTMDPNMAGVENLAFALDGEVDVHQTFSPPPPLCIVTITEKSDGLQNSGSFTTLRSFRREAAQSQRQTVSGDGSVRRWHDRLVLQTVGRGKRPFVIAKREPSVLGSTAFERGGFLANQIESWLRNCSIIQAYSKKKKALIFYTLVRKANTNFNHISNIVMVV